MDVTFIIVNYNTTALTMACVKSIYDFTKRNAFEIIIVDNASDDRSLAIIVEKYPAITFISNTENVGFGKANNQGINIAKGKYLFLLNSDTRLISDSAGAFFNYMELQENKDVACCGAALIDADGNDQISYGNFPSLKEVLSALGFLRLYKTYYQRHLSSGVVNYSPMIKEVDYVCGADMFLRKTVLNEIGGFDPDFFLYYEEVELSKRINDKGYTSVIIPSEKIIHLESASMGGVGLNLMKMEHYAKSRMLYFKKTYGRLTASLVNKIYAVQALVFFVIKGNSGYLKSAKLLFKSEVPS